MSKYTPIIDDRYIREFNELMKKAIEKVERLREKDKEK